MPKLAAPSPDARTASPLVETKPSEANDEIFLSPRIVDHTAFEDYAQRLRRLIEESEDAAQGLRGAVLESASLDEKISNRTSELARQLGAAVKVLRAFEAMRRVAPSPQPNAESNVAEVSLPDAERLVARASRQISVSVESALAELDRRASAVVASIEERQVRLEARLDALARKEQAMTEMLATIEKSTASVQEQGRDLVALHCRTADAIAKLETLLQSASGENASEEASSGDSSS